MNIFSKIPGFRSNKKRNKIIASIYYGFMLLSLMAVYKDTSSLFLVLSSIMMPFVFFGIIDLFKNREKLNSKNGRKKVVVPLVLMLVSFIISVSTAPTIEDSTDTLSNVETNLEDNSSNNISENILNEVNSDEDTIVEDTSVSVETVSEAEIHSIDTGNSDAILIKQGNESALIDAGDNDDEEKVVSYLKNQGVTKLKYVFSTHADADHCGGLDAVIDSIDVENVFVANGDADTKTYRDFITSVANKGLYPSVPRLNSEFKLGTSTFKVVSVANTNDVNNNSIVLLYTNGADKMLFMGDAGKEIENNIDVGDIDLIKIGHHGSKTSTGVSLIDRTSPEYAVILVKNGNKYGHPHSEVMNLLESRNIEVHRTDECGNIIFKSTGNGLNVDCKKASYNAGNSSNSTSSSSSNHVYNSSSSNVNSSSNNNTNNNSTISNSSNLNNSSVNVSNNIPNESVVYWTSSGKKYHSNPNCSNMKNPISGTISESGRTPCSKCY